MSAGYIRVYLRGTNNWTNSNNLLYEISQSVAGGSWTLWALPDLVGPRVAVRGNPSASTNASTSEPYVVAALQGGGTALYTIANGAWTYASVNLPSGTTMSLSPVAEPKGFLVRTTDQHRRLYSLAKSSWSDLGGKLD